MGIDPHQSFKTLLVAENGDQKKISVFCAFHGKYVEFKESGKINCVKKVEMADKDEAQKSTGYLVGGISPLGQKKRVKTVINSTALEFDTIFVSGGKRGLSVELAPQDLAKLLNAEFVDIIDEE